MILGGEGSAGLAAVNRAVIPWASASILLADADRPYDRGVAAPPIVRKIVGLLGGPSPEHQIAAAIVLGQIGAADAEVIDALLAAAGGTHPTVQRHAVEALGKLGAKRALPALATLWSSRDEALRAAAVDAAVALKEDVVPLVRARLAANPDPVERRSLEAILGRVGGKDAFSALLAALDTTDAEAARTATLAVRQRIKESSPRERTAVFAQVEKLLATRKPPPSDGQRAAALKILGYLEEPAAVRVLLDHAGDPRAPEAVRQEALIALRFTAATGPTAGRVAAALLDVAESAPLSLGRTALFSLASVAVPAALARRLGALALAGEAERARLALDRLGQMPSAPEAGAELARVLARTGDRALAEAAATALSARPDAARALARALLEVDDPARIPLLTRLLAPHAAALRSGGAAEKKLARELVDAALARAVHPGPESSALLQLARALDPKAVAEGLRAAVARAEKAEQRRGGERGRSDGGTARSASQGKARKADGPPASTGGDAASLVLLRRLGHSADATPEDGYALAVAELAAGRRDEAHGIFRQLLDRGFDLAGALRADRRVDGEARYQIGFRLAEDRHAAAEEILGDVASAGRGKVAQMAKAKLRSSGYR